jgi:hypothetical protein
MQKITKFKNCKSPKVSETYDVNYIIDTIKNGNDKLPLIKAARAYDKSSDNYKLIKTELLPTFRFNFNFENSASNSNIIGSTNLMYIDVDDVEQIPDNGIIYAKWKSLSKTGYGILVKTYNVNLDNFNTTYNDIGKWLGVDLDKNAGKATQQTILSYDPDLYFNPNSITYSATTVSNSYETKKVSNHSIKKEKECIGRNDTFLYDSESIRFNNISDYFVNSNDSYKVFEDGVTICDPFIPKNIKVGQRNSRLFFLLSQYQLLNPFAGSNFLKSNADTINNKMYPKLDKKEISTIVNSVVKKHKENTLEMHFNSTRKILFNPEYKLTRNEKMGIVNKEMGVWRVKKSQNKIYDAIEDWDFIRYEKITQKKVAEVSGLGISTVKKYWFGFKDYVKELNSVYKQVNQ